MKQNKNKKTCVICKMLIVNRLPHAKYCKYCAEQQPWIYRAKDIK